MKIVKYEKPLLEYLEYEEWEAEAKIRGEGPS
jgi:hypothetical protein